MDTSELSNENNPDFNVLNTTVSASSVAHALHNINMDAILFRAKTSPNPPILMSAITGATALVNYDLTVPDLVQSVVSSQQIVLNCPLASTGNTVLNFGSDTAANALALLSLLNLDTNTPMAVLQFTQVINNGTTGASDSITCLPSTSVYVSVPTTLFSNSTSAAAAVVSSTKLVAYDASTTTNGITTPKIVFVQSS